MGFAAVKPPVLLGSFLRRNRKRVGKTLQSVSDLCRSRGEPIPVSTLAKIEQGHLDPGVKRLTVLLNIYNVPVSLIPDLVELDREIDGLPASQNIKELFDKGVRHWKKGDIAEGLAYLIAVRQAGDQSKAHQIIRQDATLYFCMAARNLGKIRLAKHLIDELLCEPPTEESMLNVLVLASSLWRASGSSEVAHGMLDRAVRYIRPGNHKDAAYVFHQLAKLQLDSGELDAGRESLKKALTSYIKLKDNYGKARAKILEIGFLRREEKLKEAMTLAKRSLAQVSKAEYKLLEGHLNLEVGRIALSNEDYEQAETALRNCLSFAAQGDDKNLQFLAHYYLWKSYVTQNDTERAKFELSTARYFSSFVDDASEEMLALREHLE